MPVKQAIFLSIVFVVLFSWVLRMILRNRLRESHAVLWVAVALCIPVSILLYPLLLKVGGLAGFIAPVNFSFLVGFIALFIICLHFSALISGLEKSIKNSIQKIALLEEEVRRLKDKIADAGQESDEEKKGG
jgi:hypothetical protein